ncbi:MAG: hypothetical protein ACR2PR_00585 [Pseudohongiellaceae bacterium]
MSDENIADDKLADMRAKLKTANELLEDVRNRWHGANDVVATARESINEKQKEMEDLSQEIERLLPGATAAGLASNFLQAQKKNTIRIWLSGFGFVLALVAVTAIYALPLLGIESILGIEFMEIGSMEVQYVIIRMSIGIPLLWIAWYCQRSLSQSYRVKEEYHHKERVVRMYVGFAREIEAVGGAGELRLKLMEEVVDAIAKNPAEVLDPSATMLDSVLRRKNKEAK